MASSASGIVAAETTGARVRALRERQRMTQQALATSAGLSVSFLSDIENDKRNPSGRVLLAIATALGTTMDFLLRGGEAEASGSVRPAAVAPIPAALAAAAARAGMSFRAAASLHEAYRQITARRERAPEEPPSEEEWISMYRVLRRHLES